MHKPMITACPKTPNCVSSLEARSSHYTTPLSYQGSMTEAKSRLLEVINSFDRTQIVEDSPTYVSATFTSLVFRFVDDVEFLIDDRKKIIHMKSASRTGTYDLGANKRRCEAIRDRFNQ